jgi:hypothetical protein
MTERTYAENGRPCPHCGNNDDFNSEEPIYNAVRQYGELIEFPGFGSVNDIGWWCSFCGWEYGFEFSEESARGDTVTMKPYRVVLEIPREMLTELVKLCEHPEDIGKLINDLVNIALLPDIAEYIRSKHNGNLH